MSQTLLAVVTAMSDVQLADWLFRYVSTGGKTKELMRRFSDSETPISWLINEILKCDKDWQAKFANAALQLLVGRRWEGLDSNGKISVYIGLLEILERFEVSFAEVQEALACLCNMYENENWKVGKEGRYSLAFEALLNQGKKDPVRLLMWLQQIERNNRLRHPQDGFWIRLVCEPKKALLLMEDLYNDAKVGDSASDTDDILEGVAGIIVGSGDLDLLEYLIQVMKSWENSKPCHKMAQMLCVYDATWGVLFSEVMGDDA